MGGSVIVREKGSSTKSTRQFVAVAEAMRKEFPQEEGAVMRDVFSPMDDDEMTFISAMDLSPEDFAIFAGQLRML